MPAQWTDEFIGKMRYKRISSKEFAHYIGYTPEYVSCVLNGKRSPRGAEQKFNDALDKLIAAKTNT